VRNTGAYPVRLTKVLGGGQYAAKVYSITPTYMNISDAYYLAPGEEKFFGNPRNWPSLPSWRHVDVLPQAASSDGDQTLRGASSLCTGNNASLGALVINNFGFE